MPEDAGQPPQLPHDYGSISLLPFHRSWWRPAQQPHLKTQERQYCQGQKNTTTQVEKRLGKVRRLDTTCSTQGLLLSAAGALPQLFAELAAGEGTIPDGSTPQTHGFSHCPHNLDCISSSAFLVSPIPDSFFFLGSCMWCCNEDSVLKKWDMMFSFKINLAQRRLFGWHPFCQEAKCRENGYKQQLLKRVKARTDNCQVTCLSCRRKYLSWQGANQGRQSSMPLKVTSLPVCYKLSGRDSTESRKHNSMQSAVSHGVFVSAEETEYDSS